MDFPLFFYFFEDKRAYRLFYGDKNDPGLSW